MEVSIFKLQHDTTTINIAPTHGKLTIEDQLRVISLLWFKRIAIILFLLIFKKKQCLIRRSELTLWILLDVLDSFKKFNCQNRRLK